MLLYGVVELGQVFELLGLVIIFILILVITYFTTKWIGASGFSGMNSRNFKVIETYKISQTKYIQIIKIADKYVAIAVCKDHIEYLTDISEDAIIASEVGGTNSLNFLQIMKNAKQARDKMKNDKNE